MRRRPERSRRAIAASAALLLLLGAGRGLAAPGDDCPPNPEPGKCYEKVYRPALYENYVEQDAHQRLVTRQRQIRGARFDWQAVPCEPGSAVRRGT